MGENLVTVKGKDFKYERLGSKNLNGVDEFIETYRKDKKRARVKIMLDSSLNGKPVTHSVVHYYRNKQDWSIILYTKKWG